MGLARLNCGLVVFDHPDVAAGGHAGDGEVAAVGGGDSPGTKSATLVPKGSGLSLQVDPKQSGADRRLTGNKKGLAVGSPIDGVDSGPVFDRDLPLRLAFEREQADAAFERIEFGKRDPRTIGRRHPVDQAAGMHVNGELWMGIPLHRIERYESKLLAVRAELPEQTNLRGRTRTGQVGESRSLHDELRGLAASDAHTHDSVSTRARRHGPEDDEVSVRSNARYQAQLRTADNEFRGWGVNFLLEDLVGAVAIGPEKDGAAIARPSGRLVVALIDG